MICDIVNHIPAHDMLTQMSQWARWALSSTVSNVGLLLFIGSSTDIKLLCLNISEPHKQHLNINCSWTGIILAGYGLSEWETTLPCNVLTSSLIRWAHTQNDRWWNIPSCWFSTNIAVWSCKEPVVPAIQNILRRKLGLKSGFLLIKIHHRPSLHHWMIFDSEASSSDYKVCHIAWQIPCDSRHTIR